MRFEHSIQADTVVQALLRSPKTVAPHLVRALDRGAQELARDERRAAPKAFSVLAGGIQVLRETRFSRVVAPSANYAGAIEDGTGVFGPRQAASGKMPPVRSLLDWIKVKRIEPADPDMDIEDLAFVISRSIAARGTPPQPFVRPSLEAKTARLTQLMVAAAEAGLREVTR